MNSTTLREEILAGRKFGGFYAVFRKLIFFAHCQIKFPPKLFFFALDFIIDDTLYVKETLFNDYC